MTWTKHLDIIESNVYILLLISGKWYISSLTLLRKQIGTFRKADNCKHLKGHFEKWENQHWGFRSQQTVPAFTAIACTVQRRADSPESVHPDPVTWHASMLECAMPWTCSHDCHFIVWSPFAAAMFSQGTGSLWLLYISGLYGPWFFKIKHLNKMHTLYSS